ncbi:MAG: hypothetical protein WCO65_03975 [bacterium]
MAYVKRYEDWELDQEVENDDQLVIKAKMGGSSAKDAVVGLIKSAEAYYEAGNNAKSIELWAKLLEIAEMTGDKELYYKATERMGNIG